MASVRRTVSQVMLLMGVLGGVAGWVVFGLPLVVSLPLCVGGMGLSILLARWFERKTGINLYNERVRETAAKHAAEKQRRDA
jgi:hypothetical protein